MLRLDDLLIEWLFQPAAHWIARWANCFAVARSFGIGTVVLTTVGFVGDCLLDRNIMPGSLVMAMTLLTVVFMHREIRSVEDRLCQQPSAMNPLRYRWDWCRAGAVVGMTLGAAMTASITGSLLPNDFTSVIIRLANLLFVAAIYLAACQPAPPKPIEVPATTLPEAAPS